MYSLILEGEGGGPTEDRENSLIFFLFFIEPFPKHKNLIYKVCTCHVFIISARFKTIRMLYKLRVVQVTEPFIPLEILI